MDVELKQKWAAALRSEKYKQGKGSLHNSFRNEFCCLGVLCDLRGTKWEKGLLGRVKVEKEGESYLTERALAIVGLTNMQQRDLGRMNDRGITFPEIADYIEKNL